MSDAASRASAAQPSLLQSASATGSVAARIRKARRILQIYTAEQLFGTVVDGRARELRNRPVLVD